MYPSQGRFWLTFAGIFLSACLGCTQPTQKTAPGALPARTTGGLEPRVNATTYFAHGHLLERQGQFERAATQYRQAVSLCPDFLSARNRLGITLNKVGQHAEASEQFRQAIAAHPDLAYLHNNLGFSLYLEGKHAEAEAAFKQALDLKPDFARAHMNYALVLARLGRFDDAFSELVVVGSEADACFNMSIILTEAQRYSDAAHYLEAALAVRPNFDAARQQLREVARLAAEADARRSAELALAAETTIESTPAEPTPPPPATPAPADDGRDSALCIADEPSIDPGVLLTMIEEALSALQDHSDGFETLWCRLGYYLFPETAPDEPLPEAD